MTKLDTTITNHGPKDPLNSKHDPLFDQQKNTPPLSGSMQRMQGILDQTKAQRDLFTVDMTPLSILYLMSIYTGDFDKRVHMGHFQTHNNFIARIRELINMNIIGYDGQHFMKPRGTDYIKSLLEVKP